jgi:flagellar biogenesis protein FliO
VNRSRRIANRVLVAAIWAMLGIAPINAADPPRALPAVSEGSRTLPPRPATNGREKTGTTGRASSSAPLSLWGTLGGFGVMAVALLCAARWMRTHGPAGLRPLPKEALEPLGQRVIARNVVVHLVRCGSRILVLGVGPDGIRTLSEIEDPVEVDLLAGACRRRDEAAAGRPHFAELFSGGKARRTKEPHDV